MGSRLQIGVVLVGGALCSCHPPAPKPEVLSEATCPDGRRWQGRPCDIMEPPTIQIAPAPPSAAPSSPPPSSVVPNVSERPSEIPGFLELGVDPEKRFPLRAKVRRNGTIYERRDGGILDPGSDNPVLWTEVVIDPDRDGTPRRPRLLCDERNHRVAVHRDAEDLAPVALDGALVVPTQKLPSQPTASTPGVRLQAGAIVKPLSQPQQGAQRILFKGLFLKATGWVDAARVDVVFEPKPLVDDGVRDGELMRNIALKDAPTGRVVARVDKDPNIANRLFVRTLAAPRSGHVLIRYHGGDAHAVGWVPVSAIKRLPPMKLGGGGGGRGFGLGTGPSVELKKGTLLRSDTTQQILGIVTSDGPFRCAADCEGEEPLVKVSACTGEVRLRATR